MSDSTSVIADLLLTANAAGQAAKANDLFNASSVAMLYALDPATTTGLTFGYIGGWLGDNQIANDTVTLADDDDNYIVAAIATGVVSVSTATTNWDNDADYLRLYKVTTSSGAIDNYEDRRQALGGGGGGGGGGGTPGGSDTQVQFNDGGAFGGDAGLTYNKSTDTLTGVNLTATGLVLTAASASGSAGLRAPHGSAPSSPTNGDIWTTSSGLFARINGSTVGPFGGGGSPGGSNQQIQYNNSGAFAGTSSLTWNSGSSLFTVTGAVIVSGNSTFGYGSPSVSFGIGYRGIELGRAGTGLMGGTTGGDFYFLQNAFFNGTNWIYANNGVAAVGSFNNGFFTFANAGSGSTGGTVTLVDRFIVTAAGNVIVGNAAIATNATDGFFYVPTCPGTPTGTPTAQTGRAPIVIDSTNHKLYFYSGGSWRDAGP